MHSTYPNKLKKKIFKKIATFNGTHKWNSAITREKPIKLKSDDIRSEFNRDYNRILHCNAYRRLKHKTQVFFATLNDHVCTRIEHVHHVVAISSTIAEELGLNIELAGAIALGHDLGHPPFGHHGEKVLSKIAQKYKLDEFWHEKNSLFIADHIAVIQDYDGVYRPLNLTYAVRDGFITHCGEIDENGLKPRNEAIDLYNINKPSQVLPYTWEGCVVKISDKIAYLGRDIEDAIRLNILNRQDIKMLQNIFRDYARKTSYSLNSSSLIHFLILDLVKNSSPNRGIYISDDAFELMKIIKLFNCEHIYKHKKLNYYSEFASIILETFFQIFLDEYSEVKKGSVKKSIFAEMLFSFLEWLNRYDINKIKIDKTYEVNSIFDKRNPSDYMKAVLTYLSLMSDHYAISLYNKVISFR